MDAVDTQAAIAAAHSAQCGWAALTCKVRVDIDIDSFTLDTLDGFYAQRLSQNTCSRISWFLHLYPPSSLVVCRRGLLD